MAQVNPVNLNTSPMADTNGSAKINHSTAPSVQQLNKDVYQRTYDVSAESGKTGKKKIGKAILIGAAFLGVVAGAAILITSQIKKGKLLGAEGAKKYADDIQKQAENIRQEVVELFNNRGMRNGEKVADIIEKDGTSIMEEFSGGSVARKSEFIDDVVKSIEVATKKGKNQYLFDDGKLSEFTENFQQFKDESEKAAKVLCFKDGKLSEYVKDCKGNADESGKAAKVLHFEDGKLFEYCKGVETNVDGSVKAAKALHFEDGKLSEYIKDCKVNADGSREIAKKSIFEDGKLFPTVERDLVIPATIHEVVTE